MESMSREAYYAELAAIQRNGKIQRLQQAITRSGYYASGSTSEEMKQYYEHIQVVYEFRLWCLLNNTTCSAPSLYQHD